MATCSSSVVLDRRSSGSTSTWPEFDEAPRTYKRIAALLHQTNFAGGRLLFDGSRIPQENDRCEAELRAALQVAGGLPHLEASARILALEREHSHRREWVWAALGIENELRHVCASGAASTTASSPPRASSAIRCSS